MFVEKKALIKWLLHNRFSYYVDELGWEDCYQTALIATWKAEECARKKQCDINSSYYVDWIKAMLYRELWKSSPIKVPYNKFKLNKRFKVLDIPEYETVSKIECASRYRPFLLARDELKELQKNVHFLKLKSQQKRNRLLGQEKKPIGVIGPGKDLTNQRFGKLTAIKVAGRKNNYLQWLCKCDCGNEKLVRSSLLKNGETKSCGCLKNTNKVDAKE